MEVNENENANVVVMSMDSMDLKWIKNMTQKTALLECYFYGSSLLEAKVFAVWIIQTKYHAQKINFC